MTLSSQSQPQRTPNPLQLSSLQRLTGKFPGAGQVLTCSGLAPSCPFPPHPTPDPSSRGISALGLPPSVGQPEL